MTANASPLPDAVRSSSGARFLLDVAVVVAWTAVATAAFRVTGWPVTAYYVAVFAGVLAYSLTIDPWNWYPNRGSDRGDGGEN